MVRPKKIFSVGDFVFARVRGYPAWPAKITGIKNGIYFVLFCGTGDEGHIKRQNLFKYTDKSKKQFSTARPLKDPAFRKGIEEVEAALKDVHPAPICSMNTALNGASRGDDTADDIQPDRKVAAINTYTASYEEKIKVEESVNTSELIKEVSKENIRVEVDKEWSQPKDFQNVTCNGRTITPEHYNHKDECSTIGQPEHVISVEGVDNPGTNEESSENIDANKPTTKISPNPIPPYIN